MKMNTALAALLALVSSVALAEGTTEFYGSMGVNGVGPRQISDLLARTVENAPLSRLKHAFSTP
jgi:hypothetical protein